YPIERYVEAITQASIVHARSSQVFDNPIFRDSEASARSREPSQVMLTGLVGVPWQDVATDASIWDPDKMEQRSSYEVWNDTIDFASNSVTRGDLLVGNPPLDPFLTPSIAPRTS